MGDTNVVATVTNANVIEDVIAKGDLAKLTPGERVRYYLATCESLGLNPLTKPFDYLELDGKLVLYATKTCSEQLRTSRNVSLRIVSREKVEDVYIVLAHAELPDGRTDESVGVVSLVKEDGEWKVAQSGKRYFVGNGTYKPLRGTELANAMMRCETKAKRRVTLSICGLGWTDESEIETIPGARRVTVDMATGEVKEPEALEESLPEELPSGEQSSAPETKPAWNAESGARERFERWLAQNGVIDPKDFYAFANTPFEQLPKWGATARLVADYLEAGQEPEGA